MPCRTIAPSSWSLTPRLHRRDQQRRQAGLGAPFQRLGLRGPQVPAPQRQVGRLLQAVELQVDPDTQLGEGGAEPAVARKADAVGVEHHVADALVAGQRAELEDLRVDRRLPAGEHDHLGLALGRDERVQPGLDLLARQRETVRVVAGVGEAHRAVEVAGRVDLDQPDARMLLVVRAQPAVERTAVVDLGLGPQRQGPRLVEPQRRRVHLGVAIDQRLEAPMVAAALAQVDLVLPDVDLRVDDDLAHRADRLGVLDEHLVAVPLHLRHHASCSTIRCPRSAPRSRSAA
jgi:hypothetical protein